MNYQNNLILIDRGQQEEMEKTLHGIINETVNKGKYPGERGFSTSSLSSIK